VCKDLTLYVSYPMIDVFTGVRDTLWLTAGQHLTMTARPWKLQPTNERVFALPKIGLASIDKDIRGWESPTYAISVVRDKGGHWWSFVQRPRPYIQDGEIRYIFPDVQHLGDDDSVWARNGAQYTLCTYEIRDMIKDLDMWGYYFPAGPAISDLEIARAECNAKRSSRISKIEHDLASSSARNSYLQEEIAQLQSAHDDCRAALSKAQDKSKRDLARAGDRIAGLEGALASAQARVEELYAEVQGRVGSDSPFNLDFV